MAIHEVEGPDGRIHEIEAPADADPMELVQFVQQQVGAAAPASAATMPQQAPQSNAEPASGMRRFGRGIVEQGLLGPAQLMSRPLGGIGRELEQMTGGTVGGYLSSLPQAADEVVRMHAQESEAMAPEGYDLARLGGQAAPFMFGGIANAPKSLLRLAGVGAGVGGITGAATPTTGDFWKEKAIQTGVGLATGAAIPVAVTKLVGGLNSVVSGLVNKFGKARVSADAVDDAVRGTVEASGFDYANLSQQTKKEISTQVRKALETGGDIDEQAIARAAAFETVGAKPTVGQVTQEPTQWGREYFLRQTNEELAGNLQDTVAKLNMRLNELQSGTAQPLNRFEAGRAVMEPLERYDAGLSGEVDRLYSVARNQPDAQVPVNTRELAQTVRQSLKKSDVWESLPDGLRGRLIKMAEEPEEMTVQGAVDWIKRINKSWGKTRGAEGTAIGILKSHIDDAVSAVESNAGKDFMTARAAARNRFKLQDSIPALKAVADGEFPADKFMQKFVYGSPLEEFKKMSGLLKNESPDAWNQIRGEVVATLREKAGALEGGKFLPSSYARELNALEKSGKLQALFSPEEIRMLRAVEKVGKAAITGPQDVSRTGMGGVAHGMKLLNRVFESIGSPRLSAVVNMAVKPIAQANEAAAAMGAPTFANQLAFEGLSPGVRLLLGMGAAPIGAAALPPNILGQQQQ